MKQKLAIFRDKFGYFCQSKHIMSDKYKNDGLSLNDIAEKNKEKLNLLSNLFDTLGGIDNILKLIFNHQNLNFFSKKQWSDCYNLLLLSQNIEQQIQCHGKVCFKSNQFFLFFFNFAIVRNPI